MTPIEHTQMILNTVRQRTNRVILFYSCGKDSIALVDMLSKQFDEVVCVFMYFVKDLEHIEKFLRWTKAKYPNVKIMQVPHWILTRIFRGGLYCMPKPDIKLLTLSDIDKSIRLQTGFDWTIYGMKKADSLNRNLMLRGYEQEAINKKTQKVYPLSIWKNGDVLRYIQMNRLPAPIQYGKKRSNGVSFDINVFLYLRNNYPDDLKKILKAFPMAEQILFQYDNKVSKSN